MKWRAILWNGWEWAWSGHLRASVRATMPPYNTAASVAYAWIHGVTALQSALLVKTTAFLYFMNTQKYLLYILWIDQEFVSYKLICVADIHEYKNITKKKKTLCSWTKLDQLYELYCCHQYTLKFFFCGQNTEEFRFITKIYSKFYQWNFIQICIYTILDNSPMWEQKNKKSLTVFFI